MQRSVAILSGAFLLGALLVVMTAGPAAAVDFSNSAAITVPAGSPTTTSGVAAPYPSTISVTGMSGTITDVNVTLTGITHTWPDDNDILLVAPNGDKVKLMADVGGSTDISNVNLTFDQAAAGLLPDNVLITSGTYRPTQGAATAGGTPQFDGPPPAPAAPYSTTLNTFNGDPPSGTWSLFVFDDGGGDFGSISGGWSLSITSTGPYISSFAPTSGSPGDQVVITGVNFSGTNSVRFGGVEAAAFIENSPTQITATVPQGAITGPIQVTTGIGTATSTSNFTVVLLAPTVTSFSPSSGKVGDAVIVTGTNFTNATGVTFNGVTAAFVVNTSTQISTSVPAGAGTGPIAVTTAGGTGTSATNFVVKHARNVTLNLTNKAKGSVSVLDGFSACASGVPVKLQMKGQGGGFQNVNSGTTKPNGSYNLGSVTAGERYRVIAKAFTTPSGDKCLKDTSPTVKA
ncbi:MAG TPA: IPT/TIG domain-containing protein [Actinomycetota bacterium]|nr:IPT/TIG domain-containing protein [Actinomycetota bacterium]